MHLTYDPDYQSELERIVTRGLVAGMRLLLYQLVTITAILALVVFVLVEYRAPAGLMISATIAVATVCLVIIINHGVMVLHGALATMVSSIEWHEKKRLDNFVR